MMGWIYFPLKKIMVKLSLNSLKYNLLNSLSIYGIVKLVFGSILVSFCEWNFFTVKLYTIVTTIMNRFTQTKFHLIIKLKWIYWKCHCGNWIFWDGNTCTLFYMVDHQWEELQSLPFTIKYHKIMLQLFQGKCAQLTQHKWNYQTCALDSFHPSLII